MKFYFLYILFLFSLSAYSQSVIEGKVLDKESKEPISGASISDFEKTFVTVSDHKGSFIIKDRLSDIDSCLISSLGYLEKRIAVKPGKKLIIELEPDVLNLKEVIITANREEQERSEAPIAIHKISARMLDETKPTLLAEVMNKVPGVVMVNLNNEQHGMSIRQPLGLSPYFLYLEDGVPIRPAGVFNHNALIEMNLQSVSSVEVVKGPASSLYGSEAIGGAVNFITQKPTSIPTARLGLQMDNYGYFRTQFGAGCFLTKNLGIHLGGYVARQRNGWQTFSDYDKLSINARADYYLNESTKLIASFTTNDYDSEMGGSIDSIAYYERNYISLTDFAYRKVNSTRARITLEKSWAKNNHSFATFFFRKNSIGQFPAYRIRQANATLAHGLINESGFHSFGTIIQNTAHFKFLKSKLITGLSVDYSPNEFWAYYVRITRDPLTRKYTNYQERPDSMLTDHRSQLLNSAAYAQYEISPIEKLKLVIGIRYDRIDFNYDNHLPPSAASGAPDEKNGFNNLSPKIGATYNFKDGLGMYANYSIGFSPPSIDNLYNNVKVPELVPAYFDNYEIGGWSYFLNKKIYADLTFYWMNGFREIVSFTPPSGIAENRNSGKSIHQGIEYSLTLNALKRQIFFRFGGTNAIHKFIQYSTKEGNNFDGNEMPNSPHWVANMEITYKPSYIPNFRISLEWQRISSYFKDIENRSVYADKGVMGLKGVSVLNFRTGYSFRGIEVYMNILNLTDELYASRVTKAGTREDYNPASPRVFTFGITYNFVQKKSAKNP